MVDSDLVKCVKLEKGYFDINEDVSDGDQWVQSRGPVANEQ